MNPLQKQQADFNSATAGDWDSFASHRQHVTQLLAAGRQESIGRLCVLGAGNCNDLDLSALLGSCRETHLVDLDAGALTRGVAKQNLATERAVVCHGGLDVTGVFAMLANLSAGSVVSDDFLIKCREAPCQQLHAALPGPFDVVGSTCLLSQLTLAVAGAVGEGHPRFLDLLQAIRLGHLQLMVNLLTAGGQGILITDLVSSDTCPALRTASNESLPGLLNQVLSERNFFHGMNPAVLMSLLTGDPRLSPAIEKVQAIPPWRWDMGPRSYAVCAFTFRRTDGP